MASRLTTWIAAALLGCAAVVAVLLPPGGGMVARSASYSEDSDIEQALSRTWRQLRTGEELLWQRALRDSLMEMVRRVPQPPGNTVPVIVAGDSAPDALQAWREALANAWSEARGSDTTWMAIVLAQDTTVWGYAQSLVYLPEATDGRVCIAVNMNVPERSPRFSSGAGASAMLGPCAYYAAFGHPGRDVARWLAENRFSVARRPTWVVNPALPSLSQRPLLFSGLQRSDLVRLRPELVACARGNSAACAVLFAQGGGADRAIHGVVARETSWWWYRYYGGLNQREALLSDMIADFGRERFAAFWTSDLPVRDAFEQATGTPVDAWMERWARASIGAPTSASIPWGSAFAGIVLGTLAVAGAAAYSQRRQMG